MNLFFNLVGICLFAAFTSIYIQYKGLYGYNGLYPADIYLDLILDNYMSMLKNKVNIYYYIIPSVALFYKNIGCSVDALSIFLMLIGTISSSFIIAGFRSSLLFIICFISYLSIVSIGQVFLSFQWDSLLLEVTFLCIFASPILNYYRNDCRINPIISWTIRFLAWKLMFMSGVVKLQAQCPTWNKLSALEYHFATQCIPTPLAHTFHNFPPIINRFSVAGTFLIEIPLTFLMLLPFQRIRLIGGVIQIFLQFLISITGNYAFFNILTASLMVVVISNDFPEFFDKKKNSNIIQILLTLITVIYIFFSFNYMIKFTSKPDLEWWAGSRLSLNISYNDIEKYIIPTCIFAIDITIINILGNTIIKIYSDFKDNNHSIYYKLYSMITSLISLITAVIIVVMSSRPLRAFGNLEGSSIIHKNEYIKKLINIFEPVENFHIFNGYGLFRRMTGVGEWKDLHGIEKDISITSRPEVILEGLDSEKLEWKEIPFYYKPGNVDKSPPINQPHQPRLDWQMWFLALGSYSNNPWIIHLIYKLLKFQKSSSSSDVYSLLDIKNYPFHKPPKAIRALLYEYDFTRYKYSWSLAIPDVSFTNNTNGNWWYRKNPVEFIPPLDLENESLKNFLLHNKFPIDRKELSSQQLYDQCLKYNINSTNVVRVQAQSLICSTLTIPLIINVFGHEVNAFVFYSTILTVILVMIRYLTKEPKKIKKYQRIKVKLT